MRTNVTTTLLAMLSLVWLLVLGRDNPMAPSAIIPFATLFWILVEVIRAVLTFAASLVPDTNKPQP